MELSNFYSTDELAANTIYLKWMLAQDLGGAHRWEKVRAALSGASALCLYSDGLEELQETFEFLWDIALMRGSDERISI